MTCHTIANSLNEEIILLNATEKTKWSPVEYELRKDHRIERKIVGAKMRCERARRQGYTERPLPPIPSLTGIPRGHFVPMMLSYCGHGS